MWRAKQLATDPLTSKPGREQSRGLVESLGKTACDRVSQLREGRSRVEISKAKREE